MDSGFQYYFAISDEDGDYMVTAAPVDGTKLFAVTMADNRYIPVSYTHLLAVFACQHLDGFGKGLAVKLHDKINGIAALAPVSYTHLVQSYHFRP